MQVLKLLTNFNFKDYDSRDFSDKLDIITQTWNNYHINNIEVIINSIDPSTNQVYNKLRVIQYILIILNFYYLLLAFR